MRTTPIDPALLEALERGELSLGQLHQLARQVRRSTNRQRWREAVQRRCTRLSQVLLAVEGALGAKFAGRRKASGGRWHMLAACTDTPVLVAIIGGGASRTLDDLNAPITIEILVPALIDTTYLRQVTTGVEVPPARHATSPVI